MKKLLYLIVLVTCFVLLYRASAPAVSATEEAVATCQTLACDEPQTLPDQDQAVQPDEPAQEQGLIEPREVSAPQRLNLEPGLPVR